MLNVIYTSKLQDEQLVEKLVKLKDFLSQSVNKTQSYIIAPQQSIKYEDEFEAVTVRPVARYKDPSTIMLFNAPMTARGSSYEQLPAYSLYIWGFCGPTQKVKNAKVTSSECDFTPYTPESALESESKFLAGAKQWQIKGNDYSYTIRMLRENLFQQSNDLIKNRYRNVVRLPVTIAKEIVLENIIFTSIEDQNVLNILQPLFVSGKMPIDVYDSLYESDGFVSERYGNLLIQQSALEDAFGNLSFDQARGLLETFPEKDRFGKEKGIGESVYIKFD